MNETTKQSPVTAVKNAVVRNKTRILIATNVATIGVAVVMGKGLHQHNQFLKEQGLYDQFYALTPEA